MFIKGPKDNKWISAPHFYLINLVDTILAKKKKQEFTHTFKNETTKTDIIEITNTSEGKYTDGRTKVTTKFYWYKLPAFKASTNVKKPTRKKSSKSKSKRKTI